MRDSHAYGDGVAFSDNDKLHTKEGLMLHEAVERDVGYYGERGVRCLAVARSYPLTPSCDADPGHSHTSKGGGIDDADDTSSLGYGPGDCISNLGTNCTSSGDIRDRLVATYSESASSSPLGLVGTLSL